MERGNNVPRNYLAVTEIVQDYLTVIPSGAIIVLVIIINIFF